MALVAVEPLRTSVEHDGEILRVVLPRDGWSRLPLAGFLLVWLAGWSVGGVVTIVHFAVDRRAMALAKAYAFEGSTAPMLFWLFWWACAEIFVLLYVSWLLAGRETLALSSNTLEIRQTLRPMTRSRSYDIGAIRRLRVMSPQFGRTTSVAFDYGRRTIRCGWSLREAEAGYVCDVLTQHEPRLTRISV